jgi:hypothetical protein
MDSVTMSGAHWYGLTDISLRAAGAPVQPIIFVIDNGFHFA